MVVGVAAFVRENYGISAEPAEYSEDSYEREVAVSVAVFARDNLGEVGKFPVNTGYLRRFL